MTSCISQGHDSKQSTLRCCRSRSYQRDDWRRVKVNRGTKHETLKHYRAGSRGGILLCLQTWRVRGEHIYPDLETVSAMRFSCRGSGPGPRFTATAHLQPWGGGLEINALTSLCTCVRATLQGLCLPEPRQKPECKCKWARLPQGRRASLLGAGGWGEGNSLGWSWLLAPPWTGAVAFTQKGI